MHARQQLLKLIASLSAKGISRLPPERELCTELGVSLKTVKKAIRHLTVEGRLTSSLRKGHFIRAVSAAINIGIIIGEGTVSAHIAEPRVLGGIMDVLERRRCYMRLLQLSKPLEAPNIFNLYKIDGCIWYLPHTTLYPKISKVIQSCNIPIVVPIVHYNPLSLKLPKNYFVNDFTAIGRHRTEYLLKRGHRKIIYCGNTDTQVYTGFMETLCDAGVPHKPEWDFSDMKEIPERLPKVLDKGEVTAVVSDGGRDRIEALFHVLARHPWNGTGDLLIDFIGGGYYKLREKYPSVRVTAVNAYPSDEIGRCAAEVLVDAIEGGIPVRSTGLVSQIRPPDWSPYQK